MDIKSFIAGCLCAIIAGSFVGGVTGYLETRAVDTSDVPYVGYEPGDVEYCEMLVGFFLDERKSAQVMCNVIIREGRTRLDVVSCGTFTGGPDCHMTTRLDEPVLVSKQNVVHLADSWHSSWSSPRYPIEISHLNSNGYHTQYQVNPGSVVYSVSSEYFQIYLDIDSYRQSANSLGDINLDGSITASDAQLVLQYYLESEVLGNDIPDIVTWANQKEE